MTPIVRIAALYDIHANLPALEAVLADVNREDPDLVVIGGDVAWGPMPRETMDLLLNLDRDVRFLLGNGDRAVIDRNGAAGRWCATQLRDSAIEFLTGLPTALSIDGTLFCHGSPRSDTEPIIPTTSAGLVGEMLAGVREDKVVFGHTHVQFRRVVKRWQLLNPGSIGMPFGDAVAYWAVLGDDIDLRVTNFEVEAAAREIRSTGFPDADRFAAHVLSPPPRELAGLRPETQGEGSAS